MTERRSVQERRESVGKLGRKDSARGGSVVVAIANLVAVAVGWWWWFPRLVGGALGCLIGWQLAVRGAKKEEKA